MVSADCFAERQGKEAFPLGSTEVSAALAVLGSLRRQVATLLFVSQGAKSRWTYLFLA
jgi:hypothetical protein